MKKKPFKQFFILLRKISKINIYKIKMSNPRQVTCRIVFLKLGQIDTKNERYDAEGKK
jgi:hypothetical protein